MTLAFFLVYPSSHNLGSVEINMVQWKMGGKSAYTKVSFRLGWFFHVFPLNDDDGRKGIFSFPMF